MVCENLDTCTLLDELSSSTSIASSMLMATICGDNKFACDGYRSSNNIGYQWPNNEMDAMEHMMDISHCALLSH